MPTSNTQHPPFLQSFERWDRFAADQATMLFAAGEVIGRRTATMATHGMTPDLRERREMKRMVEEKQSAIVEGSIAAWGEWMRLAQAGWLDAVSQTMRDGFAVTPETMSRRWTASLDTQLGIVDAAFGPIRKRVAANRKRLAAR